ncbi:MAG TPA: hypothetical protein VIQ31_18340, partial [Phormidium sp.]
PVNPSQGTHSLSSFQPLQIVCIEHILHRLYAEVVQTVETKQICWVRPLVLAEHESLSSSHYEQSLCCPQIHDLRQGADLLLPTILFRAAMDVEVIPLLAQLGTLDESKSTGQETRLRLNQFVRELCLSYPEIFANEVKKPNNRDRSNDAP